MNQRDKRKRRRRRLLTKFSKEGKGGLSDHGGFIRRLFFSHFVLFFFFSSSSYDDDYYIRNIFVSFDYEKRSSSFISQCGSPYYIYAYIAASSLSALQDEMKSRIYSSISAVFIKYAFVSNRSCRLYVFLLVG